MYMVILHINALPQYLWYLKKKTSFENQNAYATYSLYLKGFIISIYYSGF